MTRAEDRGELAGPGLVVATSEYRDRTRHAEKNPCERFDAHMRQPTPY